MPETIYNRFIRYICVALTGYLFLQGLFTLCSIQRVEERTFYIRNNAFLQLAAVIVFLLLTAILLKPRIWNWLKKYGHILFWSLTAAVFLFLMWWVTQTAFWCSGDTEWMYRCAGELLSGNFTQWEPGGYAYMWPFQNGTILLIALLLKFFSADQSYYLFPMISIVLYSVTVICIYLTSRMLFEDKALVNIQGIMVTLYFPYAFLTMCMFGDPIGYGFGALAFFCGIRYLKTDRPRNLILSGIFMFLGICFKPNCSILLVGMVILFVLNILIRRKKLLRNIFCLLGFLLIVFIGTRLPSFYIEQLSGMKMSSGNSKWAHLAMGAQESDKAPGWYNCYNEKTFVKNNYDTKKTAAEAKNDLRQSMKNFAEHPSYAWEFYNKKLASEWNNPTFECFHVQNLRFTSLELSSFVKSTINDGGKVNILAIWFFDITQSVLLFGIFIYFLHEHRADYLQLFWGLLFIGAFVFWMFWEGKCRYVAPYMLFLIPYSFMGYRILIQRFREKRVLISVASMLVIVCFLHFSDAKWVTDSFKINPDTEEYYQYIHEYNKNFMNLRY